jgi:hypothetical protein
MKFYNALAAAIFAIGASTGANAGVVLQDDFTSGGQIPNSLNWTGDIVFQSLSGPATGPTANNASTDLVGPSNPWGITSFNGVDNIVDMDGTTGGGNVPSGILTSASLSTGDYTVTFWLSGNQRGASPVSVDVTIGSQTHTLGPLASNGPWTFETLHYTGVSGPLSFIGSGPSNQQGDLIGDVTVTTGIPEASTWAMMLAGFAFLAYARYPGRRSAVVAAL